ncbi:MAG: AraC family transcriptional regulator [Anaerococcus sp.]|nr:AraC family transcriptional regulator [Peptoniphilaceae bacterium]MDY3054893.1 AraC family transcriptional regulator [Anaerococcus sp.]
MKKVKIQEQFQEFIDDNYVFVFDVQSDSKATEPLLHKYSRFLYVLEGKGKININNKIYDLEPDTVIQIAPWQISEIVEVEEELVYYLLVYNFNLVNLYMKKDFNLDNKEIMIINALYNNNTVALPPSDLKKIKQIFENIREEFGIYSFGRQKDQGAFTKIYGISLLTELLALYLRNTNGETDPTNKPSPDMIFMYMFINSSKDITLKVMSKIFYMSESSISRYITKLTGLGFYELLQEMKLFKARFLFSNTNLTAKDIAYTLNYSDPSMLSKKFQEKYKIGIKEFKDSVVPKDSVMNIKLEYDALKIINYIYDNYEEDIDITSVSEIFNLYPNNINNMLTYYVEKSFNDFLNQIRIYKACDLLTETDLQIADIASLVGYNSTKTFLRNFKKLLDMNPSEFRERYFK